MSEIRGSEAYLSTTPFAAFSATHPLGHGPVLRIERVKTEIDVIELADDAETSNRARKHVSGNW